jgi:hypothetical protein
VERVARAMATNGLHPIHFLSALVHLPRYVSDAFVYAKRSKNPRSFQLKLGSLYPCLADYSEASGVARGHYFHQDLHMARRIFEQRPERHVDIGSRIDGFIAHLLTFMPVEYVDIRPLESKIEGLSFVQSNATDLKEFETNSVASLSSLHAAEHFGLGRYGDPIDPTACFRFMESLSRVLKPAGRLYFSVPVGRERVEFNAHRCFSPQTILQSFPDLKLVAFSAVLDDGDLYVDLPLEKAESAEFACGLFEFTK